MPHDLASMRRSKVRLDFRRAEQQAGPEELRRTNGASMRFIDLLAGLPATIPSPGVVYAEMLESVRVEAAADRAVLALYRHAGKGRWITYSHDRAEPLFGAQLRVVTATQLLEEVRTTKRPCFETCEFREPTGASLMRHGIRHAVGVQVRDLTRALGIADFAGVLAVDRRGDSPPFDSEIIRLMEQWSANASLLLKAVNERSPRIGGTTETLTAGLKHELLANQGNLREAAAAIDIPYHQARELIDCAGLREWLARLRDQRSPSPDTLKQLILERRDLRAVGAAVDRSYAELYELTRHKVSGGLRRLVEDCNLTWEQVHGPGFQRGEPPGE